MKLYSIDRAIELSSTFGLCFHAEHPGPAEAAVAGIGADTEYTDNGDVLDVWGDTTDGQRWHIVIHLTGPQWEQLAITRTIHRAVLGELNCNSTDRADIEMRIAAAYKLDRAIVHREVQAQIDSGAWPQLVG